VRVFTWGCCASLIQVHVCAERCAHTMCDLLTVSLGGFDKAHRVPLYLVPVVEVARPGCADFGAL
jgi:hypothetical protein